MMDQKSKRSKSEIKRQNIQAGKPMFEGIETNVNDPKNALTVMNMMKEFNKDVDIELITKLIREHEQKEKFSAACKKVTEELLAMPKEELIAEMEKHKNGDIAIMLKNSGAFDYDLQNKNVKVMHSSKKMDWNTPQVLFDKLNTMYGPFILDVAAAQGNSKCIIFYDEEVNALTKDWGGDVNTKCWMNPPYGRSIGKWLKKAAEEAVKGCTVVCLVPSRTGSKWFQDAVKEATEVLFLKGRVVFETSLGQPVLDKKGKPMAAPFDSCVFVFTPEVPGDKGQEPVYRWWDWKK